MTPPHAPPIAERAQGEAPAAVSFVVSTLTKRKDFLSATRARHVATPGFILQMRHRMHGETGDDIRVGFTCSKKVGKAVARNRAKRRLREIARQVLPTAGQPGFDYVLVGRRNVTAARPFKAMIEDLRRALVQLHGRGT
ncbi:MAG: ribonuclease P protein component [Pseudomonadota bacterium]